jgi:putative tricarboxylic transport membrane protein
MIDILNSSLSGLYQIFTWGTFSLMLLGMLIGFTVGILPGLGGATTLALMLPFIFKMSAFEAFAFLLGMAAVTNTTGDITSILFGVPGEPTTAATIVDGYPMTKKGEAGRALGAALLSSLVGAVFGAFSLALAIPIVRPLIMTFGSPEFFMLSILGLTFVASLSGGALLKGIIAGGIGLFLATIGIAPVSGVKRFTFGQLFLWDGIGLVPITIGFFAIPEIIDLAVQGSSIAREKVGKLGGVMEGVKDTFRHFWMVIRCSAIGTVTGIIPGMGGATSQWLAYAHAVQSSEDKQRFGKGAVEGVLGPGAANNAILGGHLITTMAFGVPVSVMMAILLGAFFIQGLVPGPDMLIPEPKGHLALTFSFVWTIVISNIITVGICFLFLKQLARVTEIRSSLVIPFIILLVYLGAFTEKNIFEDLILVILFGLLGWVMQKLDWPRPPLILGLVLGPLAENRLFLSTANYGAAWLLRPVVLLLIGVAIGGALYPVLRKKWKKRRERKDDLSSPTSYSGNRTRTLRFDWENVFILGIVFLFAWALWQSRKFNLKAGLFPWVIGFPVLALSLVQFFMDLLGKRGKGATAHAAMAETNLPSRVVRRRTLGILGWILGYFGVIWLLGFSMAGPLCTFIQLKFASREKWPITLVLTASVWLFIYGLFDRVLHVPFFTGQALLWLGFSAE